MAAKTVKTQTQNKKPQLLDLDKVSEEYGDVPEILPRLELVRNKEIVRSSATVRFEEAAPRIIPWKNEDGEDADFPVIEVTDEETGSRNTLACSATTIKIGLARIKRDAGTLLGQRAQIQVDPYVHKKWGKTFGYRLTHLVEKKSAK